MNLLVRNISQKKLLSNSCKIFKSVKNRSFICSNFININPCQQNTINFSNIEVNHFKTPNLIVKRSFSSTDYKFNMKTQQVSVSLPWGEVKCQIFGNPASKKAKPIVCIHGFLDNSNSFKPLAPYFCQNDEYYMIALDLPGHGFSSKLPDGIPYTPKLFLASVRRVIRHFGLKEFIFMCHSYGIHLSVLYNIVFKNEVKAMISIDWIFSTAGRKIDSYAALWRKGIDGLIEIEEKEKLKEEVSDKVLTKDLAVSILMKHNNHLDKESAKILLERALITKEDGKLDFSRDIRVKQTMNFLDHYIDMVYLLPEIQKDVSGPWLMIHAEPASYGDHAGKVTMEFIKTIGNNGKTKIQYETFKGTHHFHMINPAETAEIIHKFLDGINAQTSPKL